jgi:hypothetical protein
MNWIAVDNGVFVSIFGQEFIYKNQATNEETHYDIHKKLLFLRREAI